MTLSAVRIVVFSVFLVGAESVEAASCECISPPGGSVQCEDSQLAFCRVKDGRCAGTCSSPKSRAGGALAAAILSEGLAEQVTPKEVKQDERYQAIFTRFARTVSWDNRYELKEKGATVIVGVPGWARVELAEFAAAVENSQENERRVNNSGERVARLDDATIAAKIKAGLAADGDINPFNIDVDVQDGVVTLSGRVVSIEARTAAERKAREVEGVRRVINLVKVGDSQ